MDMPVGVPKFGTGKEEYMNRTKRIQANVRLPVQLKNQIFIGAKKIGLSMNDYILLAIQEKISHRK